MSQILTGNLFKLLYSDDPANTLPIGTGVNEITNLSAMPTLQINSNQLNYETYDSTYNTVLLSNKSISAFEIVVNYVPTESSTVYLDSKLKSRDAFQVILNYRQTDGTVDYAIISGYITGSSTTGSKDEVVRKAYTFTPEEQVVALRSIAALEPLYQGNYGVGSNGDSVPQYQPLTPAANSFIKVPSSQAGNPAGADMLGVGLVDSSSTCSLAMTKAGTLSLYAKNTNTAWTRILTATQIASQYLPITGGNITGTLTIGTPLAITSGGTGNTTGLAASATVLATGRTFITNLASTTAVSFNGSANSSHGVTGTLPITSGGTGATTAVEAAYNLATMPRRGNMPDGADCNDYGPTATTIGIWSIGTTAATANVNLPEVNQGVFEVFQAGPYAGTQRFTTRNGNIYTRTLTAAWTTTVHQWGAWGKVGLYGDSSALNHVRNNGFLTGGYLPSIGNAASAILEYVSANDPRIPAGCSGGKVAIITKATTGILHNLNFGANNDDSNLGFIPVTPGDMIDYSVLVAGTGMSTTSNLRVVIITYTGTTFTSNVRVNSYNPAGSSVWQQMSGTYTVPANITNIVFGVWSETTAPAGSVAFISEPIITKRLPQVASSGVNSDITQLTGLTTPLTMTQGGTGSNAPITAAYNIGALPIRGEVTSSNPNINTYGPVAAYIGIWGKNTSPDATIANGYPEDNAVGMLEVFRANQYQGMQRYTIRGGKQYMRNLTNTWNGTNGPWSDWVRTGVDALNAIGYGLGTTPLITDFDWQQADFVSGVMQAFVFGTSLNQPGGVNYSTTTSVTIETLQARGNLWVVRMTPLTTSNDNRREYTITISGVKGSRLFYATEIGRMAAYSSLVNTDLNTLGGAVNAVYYQNTDANATLARNYPEASAAGSLYVTMGAWGGQQMYITRKNTMYIRATSATWNGTDGPWGSWVKIQSDLYDIGIGGTIVPTLATFDWQQADFQTGGTYLVSSNNMSNTPAGVTVAASTGTFIRVLGASSNATRQAIEVVIDTATNAGYRIYEIVSVGAKGSRVFTVRQLYTTANVTVDANGFLKSASPIVKLFTDGNSELNNESEGATTSRISEGVYKIDGVLGLNSDASWSGTDGGFEIPLDRNKQPKLWLDYEVEEDGSIVVKTYHRTHPNSPAFAQNYIDGYSNGDSIDIPVDSFISVRVEMPESDIKDVEYEYIEPVPEDEAVGIDEVIVDDVINIEDTTPIYDFIDYIEPEVVIEQPEVTPEPEYYEDNIPAAETE